MAHEGRYPTFGEVRFEVLRHFEAERFREAAALLRGTDGPAPFDLDLGAPDQGELDRDPAPWLEAAGELDRAFDEARLPHTVERLRDPATGGTVELPRALTGVTADDVARLSGPYAATLSRLRARARAFRPYGPFTEAEAEELLRLTEGWGDDEVSLLLKVADWFCANDPTGLTARQLPIDGLGSKWLDDADARRCVLLLTHRRGLGLTERERVWQWRLLDPAWAEDRTHPRFAFSLAGDAPWEPPYPVTTVVVCENRDSMEAFPLTVPGAVCLWGNGSAAPRAVDDLPWLAAADTVLYWGDIDAAGIEVADRFLAACDAAGVDARTLAMDGATYRRYARFGVDPGEGPRRPARLDHVDGGTRVLYKRLCARECAGPRRLEQEKVPYGWVLSLMAEQGVATGGDDAERREGRDTSVAVRFSADQWELVCDAARAAELGVEAYVRSAALDAARGWE